MNTRISALLDKEVSRKEFLGLSGLAVASIFGFGTIIKLLTGKSLNTSPHLSAPLNTYGNSTYGGARQ
jgi:hypothetical protein